MQHRQPLPRVWLMTDERQGDSLWIALERLPRGGGVVFRHYGLDPKTRLAWFRKLRLIARRRRLVILLAGDAATARAWGADGRHGPGFGRTSGLHTAPAHNLRELRAAERAGADATFVSPVFPTRSHPKATALGRVRFGLLARAARKPVIALGGMTARRARAISGAYGWAGIDAWTK